MALDTSPETAPPQATPLVRMRDRIRRAAILRQPVFRWAQPLLVYLAVRGIGFAILAWSAGENDRSVQDALTKWDGQWFLGIAEGGYDGVPGHLGDNFGNHGEHTSLAFFPGYPWLIFALDTVPGIAPVGAAITVSVLSGLALALGLMRLAALVPVGFGSPASTTADEGDDAAWRYRLGLILVVLVAAAPMSGAFLMAYTEALFCALAVWTLTLLVGRHWISAGMCAAAAGLVRPTAAALVVTVVVAAIVAVVSGRDRLRPVLGAVIAPLGLIGYLSYVWNQTGEWNGWFTIQRDGWDTEFDGGASTWRYAEDALRVTPTVLDVTTVFVLAGALVALTLCLVRWARTDAWPLLVYATIVVVIDVGSDGLMNSKVRLMLPAFVLLVPVAVGLARRHTSTVVPTLIGITLVSSWYSAYALIVYPYAI